MLAASLAAGLGTDAQAQPDGTDGAVLNIDLASALRLADERNLDVAIYLERIAEASAKVALARTMAVPTIRVGGSYNRHTGNLQETSGQIVDTERASRFTGLGAGAVGAGDLRAAGLEVEVDVAEAIFAPLIAKQNRTAATAAAAANRHQVFVDVAAAYVRLLQSRTEAEIVERALQRAVDLATLTANYAEAGEGLSADAEMAAVQALLWQQRRVIAAERIETSATELVRLLHLDPGLRLAPLERGVPTLEIFSAQEDVSQLIAQALADRPEAEQLDSLLAAAEDDLTAQRYGLFIPSVALNYSAGDFGGAPGSSIENTAGRGDLTLLLYWQFDAFGLAHRARTDQKRIQLRLTGLERDKLRDAIAAEVRNGYARVRSLHGQLQFTEQAIGRSEQAYMMNRDRIFDQQGLPLEALQAMQALASAELSHLETSVAYAIAQVRLHTALGRPLDSQFR